MMARFRVKPTTAKRKDKGSLYFLARQRRLNGTSLTLSDGINIWKVLSVRGSGTHFNISIQS